MKKFVFVVLTALLFGSGNLFSQDNVAERDPLNLEYSIDLGDITDKDTEYIESSISSLLSSIPEPSDVQELTCSVTVTGSVKIGVINFEIEVTVSGPCSEIKKAGLEIATQVLESAKNAIKAIF